MRALVRQGEAKPGADLVGKVAVQVVRGRQHAAVQRPAADSQPRFDPEPRIARHLEDRHADDAAMESSR